MDIKKFSPLIVLIFLWMQIFISAQPLFAQQISDEKTAVAVADLDADGITDAEQRVLSDRLRAEIWKTQKYEVLERQKMDDLLQEQGFQLSGACDKASCLLEIGRLLPVEKIIGGSVGKIGNTWTITLRMIDIGSGRIEKTVTKDCPHCTIDDILSPFLSYAAKDMAGIESEYADNSPKTRENTKVAKAPKEEENKQPITLEKNGDLAMGETESGGGSIFGKWWFWGIVLAGAGGGAAAFLVNKPADNSSGGSDRGSIYIHWRR